MSPQSSVPPKSAASRYALFRNKDFALVWGVGAIANVVRWLEMLVVAVYVFDVTGSAFQVALMTIMRMAPLALVGIFAGAICERLDRRFILMTGYGVSGFIGTISAVLIYTGQIEIWHLAAGAFINGIVWATDFPARRTLLGEVAGQEKIGTAMSLDALTSNGTRMVGPAVGGLALEGLGLGATFIGGAALHLVTLVLLLHLGYVDKKDRGSTVTVWRDMLDGLAHVRANRPLMATLMITIVFNLFGFPVTSMIPVIGREVLDLSPFPIGLLSSADGAGAFLGGLLIAAYANPNHFKRLYFYGVFLYLDMVLLFSSGIVPWLSGAMLIIMGLGAAGFSAMQATLAFLHAAPAYRSRVMGVLTVCIGSGPIGFAHVGLLADAVGAPLATAIMAVEGIVLLIIVLLIWPEVE